MGVLFDKFFKNFIVYGLEYFNLYYGFYRGVCRENKDPDKKGRIQVAVRAVSGNATVGVWAEPIFRWAGKDSGDFCVPDVGDPVWVVYENGKPNAPKYIGGWFPKGYAPEAYNASGVPTKRIFKTKAGHELSFEDDPANQSVKLVWHDAEKDKYTFWAVTSDGSIQMANHKGVFVELRATDGDERTMIMDAAGNLFTQDKDGTKIVDAGGDAIEMKKGTVQLISGKAFVVNSPAVNLKTGGVEIGDVATDQALKGTTFLAWWKSTFMTWLNAHTHPTGVGPSGPPVQPSQPPVDQQVLTTYLKTQ